MKKLLFIFILIYAALFAACQETEFSDLPVISTVSGTDQYTVVRSNVPYKMTHSVLLEAPNDSIDWLGDTARYHNERLLVLENAGAAASDSSWSSTTQDTIFSNESSLVIDADLVLGAGDTLFYDDHGDTYRLESAANTLDDYVGGSQVISLTSTSFDVYTNFIINADRLRFNDSNTEIWEDGSDNLTFKDLNAGTLTLSQLVGEYWDRTGTDLSPTTSGDDILLASTEYITWGDGDTYLYESSDDNLRLYTGSNLLSDFSLNEIELWGDFIPGNNTTFHLGGNANEFWLSLSVNDIYVENANTIIGRDGSGNMTFVDGVTSIKTLAELAAGGGAGLAGSGLFVDTDSIILGDTITRNTYLTNDGEDYIFYMRSSFSGGVRSARLDLGSGNVGLYGYGAPGYAATGGRSFVGVVSQRVTINSLNSSSASSTIEIDTLEMTIDDDINSKGLVYDADYSTNATARSLLDSAHIASMLAESFQLADSTLKWCWDFTDSAQIQTGYVIAKWFFDGPDTLKITKAIAGCVGSGADFTYNISYGTDLSGAGTNLWSSNLTVNGAETTTTGEIDIDPDNPTIAPGNWIMLDFYTTTTKPLHGCSFNVYGHEY